MKQITFVTNALGGGGSERVLLTLANKFCEEGFNVNLYTMDNTPGYYVNPKINLVEIVSEKKNKISRTIDRFSLLRKNLKKDKSKVVISFLYKINFFVILSSLFLNKKVIISERNDPNNSPNSKFLRIFRGIIYNFANYFVFQTEDAKQYFSKNIQKRSKVIFNPINDKIPEFYCGERKKEIVAVGRLEKQKNFEMLLRAFNEFRMYFPEYKLIIYGEGSERKRLEEIISELQLEKSVNLPGFMEDVHEKIRKASIYISSSNYEGISNSMIEALAMGIPTIVTDCPIGGAKMFIKNNINGILVQVGNEKQLCDSMKKVISNSDFANKISKNALCIKENLNIKNIYKEWLDIYENINN